DGSVTILQPLIAPLYPGAKSVHEMLAAFTSRPERTGHDIVKQRWAGTMAPAQLDAWWRHSLNDGIVAGTALPPKTPNVRLGDWAAAPQAAAASGLEIAFRPDPTVFDGRYANNGWLQELPKHLTQLTWDNVALMSLETARSLGIAVAVDVSGNV